MSYQQAGIEKNVDKHLLLSIGLSKDADTSGGGVTRVEMRTQLTSPGMRGFSQLFSIISTRDCTSVSFFLMRDCCRFE